MGETPSKTLRFERAQHTADAIQRALYRFSAKLVGELNTTDLHFEVVIETRQGHEVDAQTVADFRVEVLDQVLRERIRIETESTRNLILAIAFSRSGLSES